MQCRFPWEPWQRTSARANVRWWSARFVGKFHRWGFSIFEPLLVFLCWIFLIHCPYGLLLYSLKITLNRSFFMFTPTRTTRGQVKMRKRTKIRSSYSQRPLSFGTATGIGWKRHFACVMFTRLIRVHVYVQTLFDGTATEKNDENKTAWCQVFLTSFEVCWHCDKTQF